MIKAVVDSLDALIARFRDRIRQTEESDLVTQDLLIAITSDLEQAHWMWQAPAGLAPVSGLVRS